MSKAKTTLNIGSAGTFRNNLNSMLNECYSPIIKKRSGAWFLCGHVLNTTGSIASTAMASSIRFTPFVISETLTINAISWFVSGAGATGAITQGAIYASNANTNLPTGAPVVSTSGVASTTANSQKTVSVSATLTPGIYWAALGCNDSTLTYSSVSTQNWVYFIGGMPGSGAAWASGPNGATQNFGIYYPTTVTDGVWPTLDGARSTFTFANVGAIAPNILIRTP